MAGGLLVFLVSTLEAAAGEKATPTWAEGAVLAFSFEDDTFWEDHTGTVHVRDLSDSGSGGVPLGLAMRENRTKTIELLKQHGAKPLPTKPEFSLREVEQ
jgi:hypothetical protein